MFIHNIYRTIINQTKQYISSTRLIDEGEFAISLAAPSLLTFLYLSLNPSNSFLKPFCAIILGAAAVSYLYHKWIKAPAIEQEIEATILSSKSPQKPKALFIHTRDDPNGSFTYFHSNVDTYKKCAKKYSIDRIRGLSTEERAKVEENKYRIITIMAHGTPESLNVDKSDPLKIDRYDCTFYHKSMPKLNFLAKNLAKSGKIILDSCSTAEGENNIAKAISAHIPDAVVYGSSATLYNGVGLEYAADMTPTFNNGRLCKGKDTTCIYKGGIHVHS